METLVKIKNTNEGKKLLGLLKTMNYVEVLNGNQQLIDVADLKARIKRAEKGKFYSVEESMQRTNRWKGGK
jgi:hypothetical protein